MARGYRLGKVPASPAPSYHGGVDEPLLSVTPAAVAKAFQRLGAEVREADGVESALGSALGQAGEADLVVVTGSLFVAAEAREAVLGIPPEVYPSLLPGNSKAAQWAI